jgi:putative hydrolase of the HAD superfamily
MKYTAVIFDLYGTLIDNMSHSENTGELSRIASILNIPEEQFMQWWLDTSSQKRFSGAYSDLEATFKALASELGCKVTDAHIKEAVRLRHIYIKSSIVPRPGTLETLRELAARGYRTGLITDCSPETAIVWPYTEMAPYFNATLFSCVERMTKPDTRIYRLAAERLAVTPEKCLYVGDGSSNELTGARQAGMTPVLIRAIHENSNDLYFPREEWDGPSITSLTEVIDFL